MSGVKTFSNETSERYALALFELANENSEIEVIEKNIILLLETFNQKLEFLNFLKNPTYNFEVQSKVFAEICKIMNLSKTLNNFLQLTINKRRIYFLDKILKKFIKLSSKRKGKINAILVSSKELSQRKEMKLVKKFQKLLNQI